MSHSLPIPTLKELGRDLLEVSWGKKLFSLVTPFVLTAAYFVLAAQGYWWLALPCLPLLSFFTYGSVSHDLVHKNLGLPGWLNEWLLTLIELLTLRSGHAYRVSHLNHHAHFPDEEDIEGAAARMSLGRALLDGVSLQYRLFFWSLKKRNPQRPMVIAEGFAIGMILLAAVALAPWNLVLLIYAIVLIAGAWIFPIVTVFIPHNAKGFSELTRTKLFRGRLLSLIALEHLYHLEHHLYPQVPHQNWPELARRLDPFFERNDLKPIKLLF